MYKIILMVEKYNNNVLQNIEAYKSFKIPKIDTSYINIFLTERGLANYIARQYDIHQLNKFGHYTRIINRLGMGHIDKIKMILMIDSPIYDGDIHNEYIHKAKCLIRSKTLNKILKDDI